MPLARIDLVRGKPAAFRKTLGEIVYKAMIDVINVPANDKFQVITEHAAEEINVADSYLGNDYTQDIVLIRQKLGLDRPIVTQFFIWLGHVLSGDFGESFFYKKQVAELIADRVVLEDANTVRRLGSGKQVPAGRKRNRCGLHGNVARSGEHQSAG